MSGGQPRGVIRSTSKLRRAALALALTAAAGAGAGLATTVGAASADSSGVQVQAYTLPSTAYSTPLASAELPAVPAPNGSGEWFLVSGSASGTLLEEPTAGGTPNIVTPNLDDNAGKSPFLSLVTADGDTWAEPAGSGMVGFQPNGQLASLPAVVKAFPFDAHDMTADPSGNLYIPDNSKSDIAQAFIDTSDLAKSTGNLWTVGSGFSSTEPAAVAYAGGLLWFTTDSGQLGSIEVASSSSSVSGPYSEQANGDGHTLTPGADGDLWAVGGGGSGSGGTAILRVDPQCGALAGSYSTGLPASPQISAITSGPDGNIWFAESGANQIGQLNVGTGAITNYPLPAGYQLAAPGSEQIAPGPSGSGTLFFSAETSGASPVPAIGEVTGLATSSTTAPASTAACSQPGGTTTTTTTTTTTPTGTSTTTTSSPTAVAGRPVVPGSAKVSSKGVATLRITCKGSGVCSGRMSLKLTRKERVKVHGKTVSKRVTSTIGSAKFRIAAGRSANVSIKLIKTATAAVASAGGHKLKVTAVLTPTGGKARSSTLRLIGATPKHKNKN